MQKNLFFAAVAVVCVSLFSSCGTCKKDEAAAPTTEQTQAPVEAPKEVAQAEAPATTEAPAQTAQAEVPATTPATEQKA